MSKQSGGGGAAALLAVAALAMAAGGRHHHAYHGAATASSNERLGMRLAAADGWSRRERRCLNLLWTRESGWRVVWNYQGSGAFGIPQALPGSRMASAGRDWRTDPATQIRWGLGYIRGRYGSPCAAWGHETAHGWY